MYAQRDYPGQLGISSDTIANAGCFLTSFCNLETDFGVNISPLNLNSQFIAKNVYTSGDNLWWNSITRYDSQTTYTNTVDHGTDQTAGWPSSNHSIVRFHYRSISHPDTSSGQPNYIFHFCKVADAAAHTIVDSWDGIVKHSPYGEPTGWAEYVHEAPAPLPPPAPTPASYQITETYPNGKEIQLNKDCNLWGMNYHFDYMVAHPVEVGHKQGERWTVTNKVHHENGYDYYRRDGQVDGFNINDCDDYVAPPPPPYIPPAPPAAPIPVIKAETLTLVTDLLCYANPANAMWATTPVGELKAGTYFVWGRQLGGAVNLSTSNMTDQQLWVNEKLNVQSPKVSPISMTNAVPPKIIETIKEAATKIPVTPTISNDAWKGTIASFSINRDEPEYFNSLNNVDMAVPDLDGKGDPQVLHAYSQHIPIIATIEKNRILYGLPKKSYDLNRYYCIPMHILEAERGGIFDTFKTYEEKLYTHSIKLSDHFKEAGKQFKQFIDGIKQTIAGKDRK